MVEHQEGSDEGCHGAGVHSQTSEFEIDFLVHILALNSITVNSTVRGQIVAWYIPTDNSMDSNINSK